MAIKIRTEEYIESLKENEIFVFGSNLAGIHGAGAAKTALKFGAVYSKGEGLYGNTYAIPTKDAEIETLPLVEIDKHIAKFKECVLKNPDKMFLLTAIGCGLAGYKNSDIFPLFCKNGILNLPNISFPYEWKDLIDNN